jgi:hypothetical protein
MSQKTYIYINLLLAGGGSVFTNCLCVSQSDSNYRLMGQKNKQCCVTHDLNTRKTVLLWLYGCMSINRLMAAFRKLKKLPVAVRSLPAAAKHSIMGDLKLLTQCSRGLCYF